MTKESSLWSQWANRAWGALAVSQEGSCPGSTECYSSGSSLGWQCPLMSRWHQAGRKERVGDQQQRGSCQDGLSVQQGEVQVSDRVRRISWCDSPWSWSRPAAAESARAMLQLLSWMRVTRVMSSVITVRDGENRDHDRALLTTTTRNPSQGDLLPILFVPKGNHNKSSS